MLFALEIFFFLSLWVKVLSDSSKKRAITRQNIKKICRLVNIIIFCFVIWRYAPFFHMFLLLIGYSATIPCVSTTPPSFQQQIVNKTKTRVRHFLERNRVFEAEK